MLKTISCGALGQKNVGESVDLAGWVHRRRDHGNLIFIDLRDREGVVQVVFNPDVSADAHAYAQSLRSEWVIRVSGHVYLRPTGTANPNLDTGDIEIYVEHLEILNESKTPPFEIVDNGDVDEFLRIKYRYLDLRTSRMRDILILRHRVVKFIRDFLDKRGFLEIETPILIKSTPEGARDFVVPSRLHPGKFYALPQSPQQLKQLLMVSGVEKYFQIARCFRDEDPRADRVTELTQLDLEMSFVDQSDVLQIIEELYVDIVESIFPKKRFPKPFPVLTYDEAIEAYGTDKPDLRFGLKMHDISDIAAETDLRAFTSAIDAGGIVKAFSVPGGAEYSRRRLDELVEFSKSRGAGGLVWIALMGKPTSLDALSGEHIKSPVSRIISVESVKSIASRTGARVGDLVLIIAGQPKSTNVAISALRNEMGKRLDLADPDLLSFVFVVDFPLFEWDEEDGRWDAMHHPFTSPRDGDVQLLDSSPGLVVGKQYDLVCNGVECAGGSIRVHRRDIQEKIFTLMGHTKKGIQEQFGQLLDALEYGAPPHGGIAGGIERLLMVLAGLDNIRDVIAFPKTQTGVDPLFDAPALIGTEQLQELNLRVLDGD